MVAGGRVRRVVRAVSWAWELLEGESRVFEVEQSDAGVALYPPTHTGTWHTHHIILYKLRIVHFKKGESRLQAGLSNGVSVVIYIYGPGYAAGSGGGSLNSLSCPVSNLESNSQTVPTVHYYQNSTPTHNLSHDASNSHDDF